MRTITYINGQPREGTIREWEEQHYPQSWHDKARAGVLPPKEFGTRPTRTEQSPTYRRDMTEAGRGRLVP